MANSIKNQQDILAKLNINSLNTMQEEAISVIETTTNTIILSPTGTGKTELAIQIEQVIRSMGSGYKVNAVYGGRPMSKDKIEIKHTPAILIGTPGRVLDHFNNERFSLKYIKTLVLDEFDKSLEDGFELEMKGIIGKLSNINKRILTSATQSLTVPGFVRLDKPTTINYLKEKTVSKLTIKTVISKEKNKLKTLLELMQHIGNQPGIIFCNLRDSIGDVSTYLEKNKISHACFSGGMEQKDRERALIKFRNGTCQVLVATDLASRGIDISEMNYIIHYELPRHEEEFIHRNGRTARVNSKGTAYVLKWEKELLPEFIKNVKGINISKKATFKPQFWSTLFISGGRKDKISKGDIAGLFFKKGSLNKDQLGTIELKQDCAFVAIPMSIANELVKKLNNSRLKKKKVRVTVL